MTKVKESMKFLAIPVTVRNSANVSLMVIRANEQFKKTVTKWFGILQTIDEKANLEINDLDLEQNVVLLSNDTFSQDSLKLDVILKNIKGNYNSDDVSDVSEFITNEDFELLYDNIDYNYNEDIKFIFTRQYFYINDHFEFDVIESFAINYNEVE